MAVDREAQNELADFIEDNLDRILEVAIVGAIGPRRDSEDYRRTWSRCVKLSGDHVVHIVEDLRADCFDPRLYKRGCIATDVLSGSLLAPLASFFDGRRNYGDAIATVALELPTIDRTQCNRLLETLEEYLFDSIRLNALSFFDDILAPNCFRCNWHGRPAMGEDAGGVFARAGVSDLRSSETSTEADPEALGECPSGVSADDLTEREKAISLLVAQGLTNAQIAERLSLSVGTVKNHLRAVYLKLGIDGRTGLAVLASKFQR